MHKKSSNNVQYIPQKFIQSFTVTVVVDADQECVVKYIHTICYYWLALTTTSSYCRMQIQWR